MATIRGRVAAKLLHRPKWTQNFLKQGDGTWTRRLGGSSSAAPDEPSLPRRTSIDSTARPRQELRDSFSTASSQDDLQPHPGNQPPGPPGLGLATAVSIRAPIEHATSSVPRDDGAAAPQADDSDFRYADLPPHLRQIVLDAMDTDTFIAMGATSSAIRRDMREGGPRLDRIAAAATNVNLVIADVTRNAAGMPSILDQRAVMGGSAADQSTAAQQALVKAVLRDNIHLGARGDADVILLGRAAAALGPNAGPFMASVAKRIDNVDISCRILGTGDPHSRARLIAAMLVDCHALPTPILEPLMNLAAQPAKVDLHTLLTQVGPGSTLASGAHRVEIPSGAIEAACMAGRAQLQSRAENADMEGLAQALVDMAGLALICTPGRVGEHTSKTIRFAVMDAIFSVSQEIPPPHDRGADLLSRMTPELLPTFTADQAAYWRAGIDRLREPRQPSAGPVEAPSAG